METKIEGCSSSFILITLVPNRLDVFTTKFHRRSQQIERNEREREREREQHENRADLRNEAATGKITLADGINFDWPSERSLAGSCYQPNVSGRVPSSGISFVCERGLLVSLATAAIRPRRARAPQHVIISTFHPFPPPPPLSPILLFSVGLRSRPVASTCIALLRDDRGRPRHRQQSDIAWKNLTRSNMFRGVFFHFTLPPRGNAGSLSWRNMDNGTNCLIFPLLPFALLTC